MKSIIGFIFTLFFVVLFNDLAAQQTPSSTAYTDECDFDRRLERQMAANPELRRLVEDYKNRVLPTISKEARALRSQSAPVIRVPVVVHVIHNNGENPGVGQNLSDAQIQAQIDVLNEDFSATNPNFGDTPAQWQAAAGNPEIQFCLASIDPSGNATTGITRAVMQVTVDPVSGDDNIESEIKPALNWDPNKYYNIYTLPIPGTTAGGGTTGYAYLPSPFTIGNGGTDGTVVDYRWFGGPGFSQSGYKTLTHETGHYLGLYHVFGSNSCEVGDMDCAEDDGLADTPEVDRPTSCFGFFSCNSSFPTGPMSCGNEHMYVNYMDYSSGSCKTSFTNDQIAIMRAVLDGTMNQYNWGSRLPLATNTLAVCTFNTNDAAVAAIQNPGAFQCDTMSIIPEVKITNFGITPLTTVTINYQIDNGTPVSFVWIDNLLSGASAVVALPPFAPPVGAFDFTCYTTLPNGAADEDTSNDTMQVSSLTVATQNLPLQEDFQDAMFDPTANGVFGFNPDADIFEWVRNTDVSGYSNQGSCAEFDNFTVFPGQSPAGKLDGLVTQIYDFSAVEGAILKFDLAYAPYSATFFDSLIVMASTDCGNTFNQQLYRDGNMGMATAPATTGAFVPQPNEWRTEEIDLSAFDNTDNLSIIFLNLSGYGNKLYLDNINIIPSCFISTTESITLASCFGECDGSATVTPSGGIGTYTYLWDGNAENQMTATASNLCAGSYEVTITDSDNCTAVASVTVTEPDVLGLSLLGTDPTAANIDNGTITATPIGGNSACYSYLWSNSETTQTINNLPPGNYTVTITDCNDCTQTESIVLNPFDCSGITATDDPTDILCNGDATGEILLTPGGGTSPYTYAWTPASVLGSNPTLLSAGIYTFTITDANGCTFTNALELTEPPALTVGIVTTDQTAVGVNDGTATASGGGGKPPYTFNWGAFGTGSMISNLAPGVYEVTITDANDCTEVNEGEVDGVDCSNFVISNATAVDVSCNGDNDGTATVFTNGGTGPFEYEWDDLSGQTNQTAIGLAAAVYNVTVTDANSCTQTTSVTVGSPDALEFTTFNINHITCNGAGDGSISVGVSGGTMPYTYEWDNAPGNTNTIDNLAPGDYCITVTDANNCILTFSGCVGIEEFPALSFTYSGATALDCFGDLSGQINFLVEGGNPGYTYNWVPDVWDGSSPFVENLPAGTYNATATDANGCEEIIMFEIIQPAELTVNTSSTAETTPGANDGTATALASGGAPGYTYDWGVGTSATISNLMPGVYEVTVTDANGCTTVKSVVVAAGSVDCSTFTASLSINEPACFDGSDGTATAIAEGGMTPYSYSWSNSDTGPTANNLSAGLVSVTITDANNCILIEEIEVTEPSAISLSFNITNETAIGAGDGAITAMASGGTGGYDYQWFNASTGPLSGATISSLNAGFYYITVTDANGCTYTPAIPVEIIVSTIDCSTLSSTIISTDITCFGLQDGTITASGNGGTPPYSYVWSNSATGPMLDNLGEGLYFLTITDANACTLINEVQIEEPALLVVTPSVNNETSVGASDGNITLVVNGGTPPYTYDWGDIPGNDNLANRFNLTAGIYDLTVTDANDCMSSISVQVLVGSIDCSTLSGTISQTDVSCFGFEDGTASVIGSGGESPYTYLWSNTDTGPMTENLPAGLLLVTITDANNCQFVAETTIEQPSQLTVSTSSTNETSAGTNDGTASAVASGGTPPYTYDWGVGTGPNLINLSPGIYEVTVTDANGCIINGTVTISTGMVDCDNFASFISTLPLTCSDSGDGVAAVVVSGGTPPYDYEWSNGGNGVTAINLPGGVVGVTVTDANNCVLTDEAIVEAPLPVTISIVATDETVAGFNDGTATATASGGTPPYTYDWGPLGMNPFVDNLAPGVYVVEAIDSEGCRGLETVTINTGQVCTIMNVPMITGVSCNGLEDGTVTAVASGGVAPYSYVWSNGDTGPVADNLFTGMVTVTITDADNCVLIDEIFIEEPMVLEVVASSTNETSLGANDGTATAMGSGGTMPYTYDWGGAGSGPSINNLAPGSYIVLLTDANGCMAEVEVFIEPGAPDCSNFTMSIDATSTSCFGTSDGTATVTADGGVEPYTYTWSNSGNTAAISGPAGVYTVLVVDNVGCELEGEVTITEPDLLLLVLVGLNGECGSKAAVIADVEGGTEPYFYTWSNGTFDPSAIDLDPGSYSVTVSDANGCFANGTISVDVVDSGIEVAIDRQNISCFGESDGAIDITITEGTPPFDIEWTGNGSGTSLDGLAAGDYTLQITDATGCVYINTIPIESPAELSVGVQTGTATAGINDATATAIVFGGVAPYTYRWSTGSTGPIINNLSAGTYTVTVTDQNECTAETSFSIYTTGIGELTALEEWQLSPNPSTGLFYLHAVFSQNEIMEVTVFNVLGQKVFQGKEQGQSLDLPIDLTNQPAGTYYLRLQTEEGQIIEPMVLTR